ncbi:MAG: XdhC family protein [Steroidobacterales bacterium]
MNVRLDTSLELLLRCRRDRGKPDVLATVVTTAGSTYRKPGARMLIRPDGSYVGLLSGGCLEADLASHAQKVLKDGPARCIEYDMRGPDDLLFGIGAGCEGSMRVLLEPLGTDDRAATALGAAGLATGQGRGAVLIAVHESADLPLGTYAVTTELPEPVLAAAREAIAGTSSRAVDVGSGRGRTRALVQYLAPTPHLLVCGAGPDAEPVVGTAAGLGWRVTVVDHRPAYAQASRFPGASVVQGAASSVRLLVDPATCDAAIVMSHHLASDAAYLGALAEAGEPGFIGLLGPAARRQRLATEIGPLSERLRGRLRGPVGMDIGAVTPEGIALAIVAQIHAWFAGRGTGG